MKAAIYLIIPIFFLLLAGTAVASNGEWTERENHTLNWGESVEVNDYLITAHDFSQARAIDIDTDYVMLTIKFKDDDELSTLLSLNNNNIPAIKMFKEQINITAFEVVTGNDIPAPYTKIGISTFNLTEIEQESWINTTLVVSKTKAKTAYIDDRAFITIQLQNLRGITFDDIKINETIPENLILDPDIDEDMITTLEPYSKNIILYSVKALRPGEYTIPPTEVLLTYKGTTYVQYTNSTTLTINGPYVNITKSVEGNENDPNVLDVTVRLKNEGDRAAHIRAHDDQIEGSEIVEGTTTKDIILYPENESTISYSIRMDKIAGNTIVPSAFADFFDAKGYSGIVKTDRFYLFNVFEEDEEPEVEEVNPDARTPMNKTNGKGDKDEDDGDVPTFGDVWSIKDIMDNTMRIIDEALSF